MAPGWIETKDKAGSFPARHPEDDWLMISGGFVELMRMWPISTRVNKPENDDASIIEALELAATA